jgi:hypothetical protein
MVEIKMKQNKYVAGTQQEINPAESGFLCTAQTSDIGCSNQLAAESNTTAVTILFNNFY